MKKQLLLIYLLIPLVFIKVHAQRTETYWTIGLQLNALNYFGELNPLNQFVSSEISFTRPNFGIMVSKKVSPRVHIRGAFTYGRLKGDDFVAADPNKEESLPRYGRNLHFRNDIFELSFTGTWDFLSSRGRFYRRRYITPYLMGGVAAFYHNPKAKAPSNAPEKAGEWVALKPLRTEGQGLEGYAKEYSLLQIAFPVGAGVRFRLTDRLDLAVEMGFRILMTDHIDDVGGKYPDISDLESPLAKLLSDRSAEQFAAISGKSRDLAAYGGSLLPGETAVMANYGGTEINTKTSGEAGYNRLPSYGLAGQIRGTQSRTKNDLYLITGFHLNYILTNRRYPKFVPSR